MARPEGRFEHRIDTICYHVVINLIEDKTKPGLFNRGLTGAHFQLSENVPDSRDRLMIFLRTGRST